MGEASLQVLASLTLALPWLVVAPAAAEERPVLKLDDLRVLDCPEEEGEVVVCGRRERSPYRLPPEPEGFDPAGPVDSVSRERNRLIDVGASGIHSCSTVGPGGWTGCDLIRWRQAQEQYAVKPMSERGGIRLVPLVKSLGD